MKLLLLFFFASFNGPVLITIYKRQLGCLAIFSGFPHNLSISKSFHGKKKITLNTHTKQHMINNLVMNTSLTTIFRILAGRGMGGIPHYLEIYQNSPTKTKHPSSTRCKKFRSRAFPPSLKTLVLSYILPMLTLKIHVFNLYCWKADLGSRTLLLNNRMWK